MAAFLNLFIWLVGVWGLASCAARPQAEKPLWTDIPQQQWKEKGMEVPALLHYRVLELDTTRLRRLLKSQTERDLRNTRNLLLLPLPDGSMAGFRFAPSATTAPELGSRVGSSTYFGQGVKDLSWGLAFDLGPTGFHAMITRGRETIFIEPLPLKGRIYYLCFFKHHLKPGFRQPWEDYGPVKNPNNR